jgi:hypothetical protein
MTRKLARFAILTALLGAPPLCAENRNVAILIDTSGSMNQNDKPRYTVQLSQILGDLLDPSDRLTVVRLPFLPWTASCSEGPSSRLAVELDPANRTRWKRQLDQHIRYFGENNFAAPIRTAEVALRRTPGAERLLLFIADAGGLDACEQSLTEELLRLKAEGVTIAAVNIGSSAGAFDSNPAFSFATAAQDAAELTHAVAQVYQKLLGAKQVQTGEVNGTIRVEIAPYVRQAFLVVAAEGPMGALMPEPGNPASAEVDLNYRGGGETQGLDGRVRGYRIVRLGRPAAGRFTFTAPGLGDRAGWMLIQESAVGVRALTRTVLAKGVAGPLEVELYDQTTGKRIADPGRLPGLALTAEVDGRKLTFRDDGQNGDAQAGDGIFTAQATFDQAGTQKVPVHIESDLLDRRIQVEAKVAETPPPPPPPPPTPAAPPSPTPTPSPTPVPAPTPTPAPVPSPRPPLPPPPPPPIVGRLRLGPPVPVALGRGGCGATLAGRLDLSTATVEGSLDAQVASDFDRGRALLEIDLGGGWVPLSAVPQRLPLSAGGVRAWPVRLRILDCPQGTAGQRFQVTISAPGSDGKVETGSVPLSVEVIPSPWLHCWWPFLAAAAALLAAVGIYGYVSPSRFPPRLGVVLSNEVDMNEGFLHSVRATRGAGSGFFRDARVHVCQDFRLTARPKGAVARLRADRGQVRMEAMGGTALQRQTADGTWEPLPAGETTARFATIYRTDSGSMFFELRKA